MVKRVASAHAGSKTIRYADDSACCPMGSYRACAVPVAGGFGQRWEKACEARSRLTPATRRPAIASTPAGSAYLIVLFPVRRLACLIPSFGRVFSRVGLRIRTTTASLTAGTTGMRLCGLWKSHRIWLGRDNRQPLPAGRGYGFHSFEEYRDVL